MATWKPAFVLDARSSVPLYVQVAKAISSAIQQGRLKANDPLPGARSLAATLNLHRNTISAAYDELENESWVTRIPARGTFVSASIRAPRLQQHLRRSPDQMGFRLPAGTAPASEVQPPKRALRWDYGVPDPRLLPVDALARAYRTALKRRTCLDYRRQRGPDPTPLQHAIAKMCRVLRGMDVAPDGIEITSGSQMALYLTARALLRPGDVIAMEEPGYFVARQLFAEAGVTIALVPVDAEGINVAALAHIAQRQRLRAVFVTPHHQFPTTGVLSSARRLQLLRLCKAHRIAILEDDYDHEFHYRGRPILPLASMDREGLVIHLGSFSKVLAPGIRLGYISAPAPFLERIRSLRALIEPNGDAALDEAIAELLEEGELQRHIRRARQVYEARCQLLTMRLERDFSSVLTFEPPSGGLAVWARVSDGVDLNTWHQRALSLGLYFRRGEIFYGGNSQEPHVRLGFGRLDESELHQALTLLRRALPKPRHQRRALTPHPEHALL